MSSDMSIHFNPDDNLEAIKDDVEALSGKKISLTGNTDQKIQTLSNALRECSEKPRGSNPRQRQRNIEQCQILSKELTAVSRIMQNVIRKKTEKTTTASSSFGTSMSLEQPVSKSDKVPQEKLEKREKQEKHGTMRQREHEMDMTIENYGTTEPPPKRARTEMQPQFSVKTSHPNREGPLVLKPKQLTTQALQLLRKTLSLNATLQLPKNTEPTDIAKCVEILFSPSKSGVGNIYIDITEYLNQKEEITEKTKAAIKSDLTIIETEDKRSYLVCPFTPLASTQKSPLLNLPMEVLLRITDGLDPKTRKLFSATALGAQRATLKQAQTNEANRLAEEYVANCCYGDNVGYGEPSKGKLLLPERLVALAKFVTTLHLPTQFHVESLNQLTIYFPNLRDFNCSDNKNVKDEHLQCLKNLHNLEILSLSATSITAKGLSLIPQSVEMLFLSKNRKITSLQNIGHLNNLKKLHMSNNYRLTDTDLQNIQHCRQLKDLNLADTNITNKSFQYFPQSLTHLNIARCRGISHEDVLALQKLRPALTISWASSPPFVSDDELRDLGLIPDD